MFGWLSRLFGKKKPAPSGLVWSGRKGKGVNPELDVPVAVILPMVIMMRADTKSDPSEIQLIHMICQTSPIFMKPSRERVSAWIREAEKTIDDNHGGNPQAACREAKSRLSAGLCETAFGFALLVSYADENIDAKERSMADNLVDWLGVEKEKAKRIHEVVDILRHGLT